MASQQLKEQSVSPRGGSISPKQRLPSPNTMQTHQSIDSSNFMFRSCQHHKNNSEKPAVSVEKIDSPDVPHSDVPRIASVEINNNEEAFSVALDHLKKVETCKSIERSRQRRVDRSMQLSNRQGIQTKIPRSQRQSLADQCIFAGKSVTSAGADVSSDGKKSPSVLAHHDASQGFNTIQSAISETIQHQPTTPSITMNYALKHKLIEKKRELQQRARRTMELDNGKGSANNKIIASTSIFANKKQINFTDIRKAEKESL